MIGIWAVGLVRRRAGRLGTAAIGVAVAVALLASLGAFVATSQASMTSRAVRDVVVDWQVEAQPGSDPSAVLETVRSAPGTVRALPVGFGQMNGLGATSGGTSHTTGPAVLLGMPDGYRDAFPRAVRTLAGADRGTLLAQQTAANLGVGPGDTITIATASRPVSVRVDGVVDLPAADSLFQNIGAPPGSQPAAPPDNVVLMPAATAAPLFAAVPPSDVHTQIHATRSHDLPAGPAAAYTAETGAARNVEAAASGTAVVGDNLGVALDAARSDAAYAQVLFLFLGLPGAVLAALLTTMISSAGADRRRRELAVARMRGATVSQVQRLAAVEGVLVGIVGVVVGLVITWVVSVVVFGSAPASPIALTWAAGAAVAGFLIALIAVLVPARRDLRGATVTAARQTEGRAEQRAPGWARAGLDVVLLAIGGLVVWASSANGYQLVLAPEGTPTISVSYWAFAGPALLWIGSGLLIVRLVDLLMRRTSLLGRGLRPIAAGLAPIAAAMLTRRRRLMARAVALLALSLAFAASTATFNTTYRAQAEADALLTNGADVTVTESPGVRVGPSAAGALGTVPGVRAVEPVQHRFAYIGPDLQDLYGVRPDSVTAVTALQDSYFQGGTARDLMAALAARPDSLLVSAETVKDYQLQPGDQINLRVLDPATKRPATVPFHYAGIVKEFPTAPKDSFFVANASYVARATGSDAIGAFLVDTGGGDVTAVADRVRTQVGSSAAVTDIAHTRSRIGSSLTAVDLSGLTAVELAFALVLAAGAGGLVLFLSLAERRRTFSVATALGATRSQLGRLVAAESVVLTVGGLIAGAALATLISQVLVAILTGVFDPPPDQLSVPWGYLVGLAVVATVGLGVAAAASTRGLRQDAVNLLREG